MVQLEHILVATDFSEPSETALTYGRALAEKFGATLHVVNVVDDLLARGVGLEGYVGVYPELQKEIEEAAAKELRALVANDTIRVTSVILTSNAPAQAIVDYARKSKVDLLVIGTHGRGGMAHLMMGSVAERVVRTAACPVLTVHRHEHGFVQADALAKPAAKA